MLVELGPAQTVELLTFICFEYAGQMLAALMGDEPASENETQAFHAWSPAARLRPDPVGSTRSRR